MPSTSGMQESKILKGHAVLSRDLGIVKITLTLLIILILEICISANSNLDYILHIFYSCISYLALLALIFYNRTTVTLTPEKIVIRRCLFKSLVLRKEDIMQTSVSRSKSHSLRWLMRLLVLVTLAIRLPQVVASITRTLQESAPTSEKLSLVMVYFWNIAFVIVIYYIFELLTPYQQTLKITTRSNLNMEFFTDDPEEIMAIIKKENE